VLNSVLSGVLISVAGLWVLYVYHWLWRAVLADAVRSAVDGAMVSGFIEVHHYWFPRLVVEGSINGVVIEVSWRWGLMGPRCCISIDGVRHKAPFIRSAEAFDAEVKLRL